MVLRLTRFTVFITLCVFFVTSTQAFTNNLPRPSKTAATPIVQLLAVDDGNEENTAESKSASTATAATTRETPKPVVKCPHCDRCDGSGRILGGIAVVLPWWPIKAYRPCVSQRPDASTMDLFRFFFSSFFIY